MNPVYLGVGVCFLAQSEALLTAKKVYPLTWDLFVFPQEDLLMI